MDVTAAGAKVSVTVTVSVEEFARALAAGRLVVPLGAGAGTAAEEDGLAALGLTEAEIAAVCGRYGPESPAANLLWEVAQAGDDGIGSADLRRNLGIASPRRLAGVFSGIAKVLAREVPGRAALFLERRWQPRAGEYRYRMPAPVRAAVLDRIG